MSRVLAGSLCAVVARRTGAQDLIVVHRNYGLPGVSAVAVFADVCCRNMCLTFARSVSAVVTTEAIVHDIDMVEVGRQPGDRSVAVVAVVAAVYVSRVLAACCDAVMAGAAGTYHLRVVNRKDRRPDVRCMAVFADVAGLHVRRAFAGGIRAVMAAHAVPCDIHVIEIRRQPASGRVAVVTVIAAGDVVRVFAACRDAVVT